MTEKERDYECPLMKNNPGTCPFVDEILELKGKVEALSQDVSWLKKISWAILVTLIGVALKILLGI